MKKHVVWFNFMLVDYTRDAFIYVMNVCMKNASNLMRYAENLKDVWNLNAMNEIGMH